MPKFISVAGTSMSRAGIDAKWADSAQTAFSCGIDCFRPKRDRAHTTCTPYLFSLMVMPRNSTHKRDEKNSKRSGKEERYAEWNINNFMFVFLYSVFADEMERACSETHWERSPFSNCEQATLSFSLFIFIFSIDLKIIFSEIIHLALHLTRILIERSDRIRTECLLISIYFEFISIPLEWFYREHCDFHDLFLLFLKLKITLEFKRQK